MNGNTCFCNVKRDKADIFKNYVLLYEEKSCDHLHCHCSHCHVLLTCPEASQNSANDESSHLHRSTHSVLRQQNNGLYSLQLKS